MRRLPLRSPPRMRGKDLLVGRQLAAFGITPAYAGKSHRRASSGNADRDHPRVCGEKISFVFTGCSPMGSPPRMRGKGGATIRRVKPHGITPAYAGKRPDCSCHCSRFWDHPRVCGEKAGQAYYRAPARGSPPRMRGKAIQGHPLPLECGITPAYAGKSVRIAPVFITHRDHPRVCGEKRFSAVFQRAMSGSPPRMRGKEDRVLRGVLRVGITPAYAGKRAWFSYCGCQDRDHPRVCGEKALSTFSSRKYSGSPPRMRGKVLCGRSSGGRHGITPAYAGKRGRTIRVNRTVKDYPRVCGEKSLFIIFKGDRIGITPACAGKRDIPPQGSTAPGDHPRVCGEKPELPPAVQRHVGSPPRMRGKE